MKEILLSKELAVGQSALQCSVTLTQDYILLLQKIRRK